MPWDTASQPPLGPLSHPTLHPVTSRVPMPTRTPPQDGPLPSIHHARALRSAYTPQVRPWWWWGEEGVLLRAVVTDASCWDMNNPVPLQSPLPDRPAASPCSSVHSGTLYAHRLRHPPDPPPPPRTHEQLIPCFTGEAAEAQRRAARPRPHSTQGRARSERGMALAAPHASPRPTGPTPQPAGTLLRRAGPLRGTSQSHRRVPTDTKPADPAPQTPMACAGCDLGTQDASPPQGSGRRTRASPGRCPGWCPSCAGAEGGSVHALCPRGQVGGYGGAAALANSLQRPQNAKNRMIT